MGNCSPKAGSGGHSPNPIRVLTDSGSVLEFKAPKFAHEVLDSHPGHRVFRRAHGAAPMRGDEELLGGRFYYLLPLQPKEREKIGGAGNQVAKEMEAEYVTAKTSIGKGYVENLENGSGLEVLPSGGDGVWKVKLVIDTKELVEILSEQGNTEALIERMRMAATGSGGATPRHSRRPALFSKAPADRRVGSGSSRGYWQC